MVGTRQVCIARTRTPITTAAMPRKSNRATVIQHLQRQKVVETDKPEAYEIATTNTLHQSELEPDDGSDDFEDFDEDMEVFALVEAVDIDILPW